MTAKCERHIYHSVEYGYGCYLIIYQILMNNIEYRIRNDVGRTTNYRRRNLSWPTFYGQILQRGHFFSQPITTLGEVVFENDSSNHCHLSVAPHRHKPPDRRGLS